MDKRTTILVADDDEVNRQILRRILEEEYDVLEAEDGREALDLLRAHQNEIEGVIMDLIMPRMDGYAFLEEYSKEEAWKNIPVLAASGDERNITESRCLKLGAWDFLRKPYNPAIVYLRLKNNISRRKMAILERERVMETFSRYMEPAVVEELLSGGVSVESLRQGSTVDIAVLFVDMRGFTSMSERMDPRDVVLFLNDFLTLASDSIKKYGGTLDKFMGDCAMAFWGAPVPCEDMAYQACQAAEDMVRRGKELSRRTMKRFGIPVEFGVGIHMGPAVVGSFGAPDRMDYTAIGDTVNTAARLEGAAPGGAIYISRTVAEALGGQAKYTSLGKIRLKGKKQGFEVLTLDRLLGKE